MCSSTSGRCAPRAPVSLLRRRLAALLAAGVAAPALFAGCGGGGGSAGDPVLHDILARHWRDRFGARPGGLSLQLVTPAGTRFASTLPGVGPHSHFRAASMTKTFTAAAIMLLDQRGLLRIDDAVTAAMPGRGEPYLPATQAYAIAHKDAITLRLLLQHRAGVFDLSNQEVPASVAPDAPYAGRVYSDWVLQREPAHTFTLDELAGVLARHQLANWAPGTRYGYSDSGYMLLGKVIERVSGLPLHEFKARELLRPNGLERTHFVADGAEHDLPAPFIEGWTLKDGPQAERNTSYNYTYDPGSGNLVTTPHDLARWVRRLLRGEAGIHAAQVARMCELMPDSHYGLGITRRIGNGVQLGLGHNGGTPGYLTDGYHDPATDWTFVLQCSLIEFRALVEEFAWLGGVELELLRAAGWPERAG